MSPHEPVQNLVERVSDGDYRIFTEGYTPKTSRSAVYLPKAPKGGSGISRMREQGLDGKIRETRGRQGSIKTRLSVETIELA